MTQPPPHGPHQPHQPPHGPQSAGYGYPPPGPQPPKKGLSWWAITGISIAGVFAFLIVLGLIVGPQDTEDTASSKPTAVEESPKPSKPATTAPVKPSPSKTAAPTSAPPSPSPTIDMDKIREAAGLPPSPKPDARAAYLAALNAIDTRIIKPNKEDQAVSRGINQCGSIKRHPEDKAKLAEWALDRFTVNTRLPEIATPDTGARINTAVHEHLCPDF
ncbi:hypothetical protein [Streptomyces zhihengii]